MSANLPRASEHRSAVHGGLAPKALPQPLLFEIGEQRLAVLDQLARPLWLSGLTHSQGTLEPRLQALNTLREELFNGLPAQPAHWQWPPEVIASGLAQTLNTLDLQRFCQGQAQLSDTVLLSILFHLDFIVDYQDRGANSAHATAMAMAAPANNATATSRSIHHQRVQACSRCGGGEPTCLIS